MIKRTGIPVEYRKWLASVFMLVILVGLLVYLTFIPVPAANRDIIITLLAVLLGAGASAMPNLFGDRDAEKEALRAEIAEMRRDMEILAAKHQTLSEQHDRITNMLIQRHVVSGEGWDKPHNVPQAWANGK